MFDQTNYCPNCGQHGFALVNDKKMQCGNCAFTFFRNASSAVAALIIAEEALLVAVRARDPGKGLYDLPGGFVDPGETLEEATRRELLEELGVEFTQALRYVGSGANPYQYADVLYEVTDAFFEISLNSKPDIRAQDDVESVEWIALSELRANPAWLKKFAFSSQRLLLANYLQH